MVGVGWGLVGDVEGGDGVLSATWRAVTGSRGGVIVVGQRVGPWCDRGRGSDGDGAAAATIQRSMLRSDAVAHGAAPRGPPPCRTASNPPPGNPAASPKPRARAKPP